jgi:hypothetical protein
MLHRLVGGCLACTIAMLALGCGGGGGGPSGVRVTGSVIKDGKGQSGVSVGFTPADPSKGEARGARTDAEGKFQTNVMPGSYTVTLSRMVDKKGNVPADSDDPTQDYTQLEASGALRNAFPPKYAAPTTSPFKVEIPAGGKELEPFDVK